MHPLTTDIEIAAQRWRKVQRSRLEACRDKRRIQEAERGVFFDPALLRARLQADAAVAAARREERRALRALAKLCDQTAGATDVMTVDEGRALPRIGTEGVA